MAPARRTTTLALLVLGIAALAFPVEADSIYLKNGRVIHSQDVRIEADRVVFLQHGSMQTIPMALVDRVEKNDRGGPVASRATAASQGDAGSSGTPPRSPISAATIDGAGLGGAALAGAGTPDERMRALTDMLGQSGGGGVDASQALGLLQSLSGSGGSGMGDIAGQLGALGALGGGLGTLGEDMEKAQTLLPLLAQLGAALFAPEYSEDATSSAVRNLLSGLSSMGVSQQQIEAEAQRLGVPPDLLKQLQRR